MILVIDTETTHYKPELARVIDIGAVSMIRKPNGTVIMDEYESLSNPGVDLDRCERALAVSGISKDEVLGARPEAVVAQEFRD